MRCIYCLETNNPSHGVPHVFPEAIMQNDGVLPRGSVCDRCNNYLGQLDTALVAHPLISLAIQFHGLRGKAGKARDKLANVDRTVHPYGITIPCAKPEPLFDNDGHRTGFTFTPLFDRTFDLWKFRRALHHVAFNLTAAIKGVDAMFDSLYEKARKYVRFPNRREEWPYGQYVASLEQIERAMFGGLYDNEKDEYVGLRLFQTSFFVDLRNSGGLEEFLRSEQPPGTELVRPGVELPTFERQGKVRYRFTIVLDESHPDAP